MRTIRVSFAAAAILCFAIGPWGSHDAAAAITFTDMAAGLPGVMNGCMTFGDYDSDGDLDVALSGFTGTGNITRIYRQDAGVLTDIVAGLPAVQWGTTAWGDYDNDGDLDLFLMGDTGSGLIARVYRNQAGSFVDANAGLAGTGGGAAAWGDYDNDGDLDLLMAGTSGAAAVTRIYRNDGGAFSDIGAALPGVNRCGLAWGDYDNDGDLDILMAGNSATGYIARIYRNDAGTFVDAGAGLTQLGWSTVAWGDYDADGDLDLAIAGDTGLGSDATRIYRNDGAGVFTDLGAGILGIEQGMVTWGDYDNDGDLDLLVSGAAWGAATTRVYRNDGAGGFNDAALGLPGFWTTSASWMDIDNDGDLDIGLAGGIPGGFGARIYRSNGATANAPPAAPGGLVASLVGTTLTLSWSPATDAETPANGLSYNLRVGTVPGGSEVVSAMASSATGFRRVAQPGNAQLRTAWSLTVPNIGIYYASVQAIDGAYAGSTFSSEASASSAFSDLDAGLPGVTAASAAWGDYDDDGDLDLALTGTTDSGVISRIYRNDGGGAFADIAAGLQGVASGQVAWGDWDNDGDMDLVLTGSTNVTSVALIYRNDSGGVFTELAAGLPGLSPSRLAWGDCDNDGDLDLALTGYSPDLGSPLTRIYRNDGDGLFSDLGVPLPSGDYGCVAWGDADNDGDLDLLYAGGPGACIYRNDGAGVFTDMGAALPLADRGSAAWGDYDNDGDLDVLFTGLTGGYPDRMTSIYRNDGAGAFTDIGAGLPGVIDGSATWGDWDNDGDLDLAVAGDTGSGYATFIYRNDGGATFTDIGVALPGVMACALPWGDYDDDGDLDLVLAGYTGSENVTRLIRNESPVPNTVPTAPAGLMADASGDSVTFSWSPASDGQTPAAGLSYNLRIGATPGGSEIYPAMADATGWRKLPQLGNVNTDLAWTVPARLFQSAGSATWSVQAIDGAWAGSPFGSEQPFTLAPTISGVSDVDGDQGRALRLNLAAAPYDQAGETLRPIATYNVWQRADNAALLANVATYGVDLDPGRDMEWTPAGGRSVDPPVLPAGPRLTEWRGRYFVQGTRLSAAQDPPSGGVAAATTTSASAFPAGTWELVGSFAAAQLNEYTYRTTTVSDSPTVSVYAVSAHTTLPSLWFLSDPDSGWSVDNIAPGVPQGFSATFVFGSGVVLGWLASEAEDFQYFRVYRGDSPDFPVAPENLVHSTASLGWTDPAPPSDPVYYQLTALDHAGNESQPAASMLVVGVRDLAPPARFALHAGVPNPFARTTTIAYDLAQARDVRIELYDLQGRQVRSLVEEALPAGRYRATWNGTDRQGRSLPAGTYLCRMRAGSFDAVRRLVLVR